MTTTQQLNKWMRHDLTFVGVFPLDMIPHLTPVTTIGFIVNTHPNNLSGQHWIAVRIIQDQAWIFDPLAYPPVPDLCHHLQYHCHINTIHVCTAAVQSITSETCGLHCVYFLYTAKPASSEMAVKQFISKL